jgi:nucleotide-binding universal stress UspA family protein
MIPLTNHRWGNPATILFATELPAEERLYAFALAQARNAHAKLIIFHAYDTLVVSASETSGVRYYDYGAAAETELKHLQPLADRTREAGVECELVVRQGLAPRLILDCAREKNVDRIILGTHSPGRIGKIVLGSVAEEVLRSAEVPVCVIGPDVIDQAYQGYKAKAVVCATTLNESCFGEAALAAEIAARDGAKLVLLHVLKPSDSAEELARRTIEQMEADLDSLVPSQYRHDLKTEVLVVPGEPAEEILFQAKTQRADLLVLGSHEASLLATLARHGVVYRVLGHAPCPVITLSQHALQHAVEVEKAQPHAVEAAPTV